MSRKGVFFPRARPYREDSKSHSQKEDDDYEHIKAKIYYDEWKAERDYKITHSIALDHVPSMEELREQKIKDSCDMIVCLVIVYIGIMMAIWLFTRIDNG